MKNSPQVTNGAIPVLSVSPVEADSFALQEILTRVRCALESNCEFAVIASGTLTSALAALLKQQFAIVICERDVQPGSWKDLLQHINLLPNPPSLIVTSRLADDRLWAEALNLGAYDVLAKPFDGTEVRRVVCAAWRAWSRPGPGREARQEGCKWNTMTMAEAS